MSPSDPHLGALLPSPAADAPCPLSDGAAFEALVLARARDEVRRGYGVGASVVVLVLLTAHLMVGPAATLGLAVPTLLFIALGAPILLAPRRALSQDLLPTPWSPWVLHATPAGFEIDTGSHRVRLRWSALSHAHERWWDIVEDRPGVDDVLWLYLEDGTRVPVPSSTDGYAWLRGEAARRLHFDSEPVVL